MKILTRCSHIYGSIHTATYGGTTFYKLKLEDLIEILKKLKSNVWVIKAFQELGWDAIEMDNNLYGSKIIEGVLYLCVTDGYEIQVGDELYDPEAALESFDIEDLEQYIQEATEDVVDKYITEYEIKSPDFNGWAKSMLMDGITFTELVQDYYEFV